MFFLKVVFKFAFSEKTNDDYVFLICYKSLKNAQVYRYWGWKDDTNDCFF